MNQISRFLRDRLDEGGLIQIRVKLVDINGEQKQGQKWGRPWREKKGGRREVPVTYMVTNTRGQGGSRQEDPG